MSTMNVEANTAVSVEKTVAVENAPAAEKNYWMGTASEVNFAKKIFFIPSNYYRHSAKDIGIVIKAFLMDPETLETMINSMREYLPFFLGTKIEEFDEKDKKGIINHIKRVVVYTPCDSQWKIFSRKYAKYLFVSGSHYRLHVEKIIHYFSPFSFVPDGCIASKVKRYGRSIIAKKFSHSPNDMEILLDKCANFFPPRKGKLIFDPGRVTIIVDLKYREAWINAVKKFLALLRKDPVEFGDIQVFTKDELEQSKGKVSFIEKKRMQNCALTLESVNSKIIAKTDKPEEAFELVRNTNDARLIFCKTSGNFLAVNEQDFDSVIQELAKHGVIGRVREIKPEKENGVTVYEA